MNIPSDQDLLNYKGAPSDATYTPTYIPPFLPTTPDSAMSTSQYPAGIQNNVNGETKKKINWWLIALVGAATYYTLK